MIFPVRIKAKILKSVFIIGIGITGLLFLSSSSKIEAQWVCDRVFNNCHCDRSCLSTCKVNCGPDDFEIGCVWWICPCVGCEPTSGSCCPCTSCGTGGCFTGETEVDIKSQDSSVKTQKISELKEGDIVESFNPETGEISEGTVSDVTKTMREGYYILETEGGYKVKVTREHPFLAIKKNNQALNTKLQTTFNKLEEIFSHTLTYKLLTALQARF